jgi:hypothetical protein
MLAIEQRYWRGVRVVGASIIADSVFGQSPFSSFAQPRSLSFLRH